MHIMSKLQAFISRAILLLSAENDSRLGDRTLYVGASDIAGCPRKAVLGKLQPKPRTVKELLVLMRGHYAQSLFSNLFKAGGAKFEEELELCHPDEPRVKCHIDFTFMGQNRIHIVEMKSTDGIPDDPYGSWVEQLHVQMGLAKLHYQRLGVQMDITGSILVFDLNKGDFQEFNGFVPNEDIFESLMRRAGRILFALAGEMEAECAPGFLCGDWCPYRTDCPAFAGAEGLPEDVADAAADLASLMRKKKALENEIDVLKLSLLSFTGDCNYKGVADGVSLITTLVAAGEAIDLNKLKADYPEAFAACKKTKRGYMKVEAKRLPPPVAKEEKKAT
jgi:CRISPR-associated exonuclease Cas4